MKVQVLAVETVTAVYVVDILKRTEIDHIIWEEENFFRLLFQREEYNVGDFVAARYTDGERYRGIIHDINRNEEIATVTFIDYRETKEISLKDIYDLDPDVTHKNIVVLAPVQSMIGHEDRDRDRSIFRKEIIGQECFAEVEAGKIVDVKVKSSFIKKRDGVTYLKTFRGGRLVYYGPEVSSRKRNRLYSATDSECKPFWLIANGDYKPSQLSQYGASELAKEIQAMSFQPTVSIRETRKRSGRPRKSGARRRAERINKRC